MEEHRKRLETLLLGADDLELIAKLAKLLPVIQMAEQMRAMTENLRADINARLPFLRSVVNRLARQATEKDAQWSLVGH